MIVVAIAPILLCIRILINAQAFKTTPAAHACAMVLELKPRLAAWTKTLIDGVPSAAGTSAGQIGVLSHEREIMTGGTITTGHVLGAIGAFVADHNLQAAAMFAGIGATLKFFGFIHGGAVGFAKLLKVALAYLMVASVLYTRSRV